MTNGAPSVLFVCLGNICRSPLAEAVFREKAVKRGFAVTVDSAGTGSWHVGEPPCDNSIRVAGNHGLDIRGLRARQVNPEDAKKFDLVVGLDSNNVSDLKRLGMANVRKLGDYGYNGEDVPDPYFFPGFEGFDRVYTMIERCCEGLLEALDAGRA